VSEQNDDRDLDETEPDETPGLAPDEEEEAAEHEEAEAPAPAPPSSEATLKKADAENRRYHKKLDAILGADSGHRECPACQGLGITWQQEEVPTLLQAKSSERCDECDGWAIQRSGAREGTDQWSKPCEGCGGRGWKTKIAPPEVVATMPTPQLPTDTPIGGQYVPGKGFIPYGATEPLPGTNFGVT
jgi:hypothetical protein